MPIPPESPRRGVVAASAPSNVLQILQGVVLVVAILYFASDLLIPLVLSVLLAFVLAPVMRLFRRIGAPRVAAVLLAVLIGFVALGGVGLLMGRQATMLAGNLPGYQAAISEKLAGLQSAGGLLERVTATLNNLGHGIRRAGQPEAPRDATPAAPPPGDVTTGGAAPSRPGPSLTPPAATASEAQPSARDARPTQPVPVEIRERPPSALETLQRVAEPLLHPLATSGIVLILVIFILLYREDLRDRFIRLAGARDLHRAMAAMDDAAYRLSRFFLVQVAMNAGFGTFIAVMLWLIGIPNPVLWGIVAGLMRFVPFIGSYIAGAMPALLALAVDPGWTTLILVLALFAASEMAMGQVFEPWIFGHSTGLSPIAVIAAATFWTWLWGPIGLLLAVPLTVCLVVLGRHVEPLEFLEVMLGDEPPLEPEETFYQRALAGDVDALAEQSERCIREKGGLEAYLDEVAIPALRLAQADAMRDALAEERLGQLRQSVLTLMEDLEEAEERRPAGQDEAVPSPPAAWRAPGAVQCVPGRGAFDGLLAAMLAQVLADRDFGVQLGGPAGGTVGGAAASPQLVCLCMMEGGASAATARYLLRRMRRRLPGVPILALAWREEAEAPRPGEAEGTLAAGLRAEGGEALMLVAGMRQAVALAVERAGIEVEAPAPETPPDSGAPVPEILATAVPPGLLPGGAAAVGAT